MSGLALVCDRLGAEVSGSDRADSSYMERLRTAGIDAVVGHDAARLPEGAEVVVSTAIDDGNPELAAARERGAAILHRGELLAELCAAKPKLIAVPGGDAANAGWGEGEWAVAEADESDGSFLRLEPGVAVVTNIEMDHHSKWATLERLTAAFESFLERSGRAVLPACEPAHGHSHGSTAEMLFERWSQRARDCIRFGPTEPGPESLPLSVPGAHNVLNARAALAAIVAAGLDVDAAAAALASFPGVHRRLELRGSRDGARVYDDYAHHPTEVRAALSALRELQPRRLIAVFQPHLYSRTKALAEEFGAALSLADEAVVLDVYPAREEPVGELAGVSGLLVARAAAERMGGRPVWWLPRAERAQAALEGMLGQGDVAATIGAGDIFKLAEALVEPAEGGAA
jgi:UDP-N-acetylmuramate--alanine ligase